MKSLMEVLRTVRETAYEAHPAAMENLLKTLIQGVSNDRSPYGINGYPFVKPLVIEGDAILYICPKTVQTKEGFSWNEVPGVSAQWRTPDGWQNQAYAIDMDTMAAAFDVLTAAGAQWVDPDVYAKDLPSWYVALPNEALLGAYMHSDYQDRALMEQHTDEGEVLMQLDAAGLLRQAYIKTDGALAPISRDELAKRSDTPMPGI